MRIKNEAKKLVIADLKPENIKINLVEKDLSFSDEVEQKIEEIWNKKTQEAEEKNLNFYNGKSYRIVNWEYENNILELDFSIYDYKHRFGVNKIISGNIFSFSEVNHGGSFVGSEVVTSDNKFLMVKISGKSMNNNNYDLLGGIIEDDIEFIPTGDFLFKTIKKEMLEEGGIKDKDIKNIQLKMFYQGIKDHTGFYFKTKLSVSSQDLLNRFKNNEDIDIESIHFYNKKDYLNILKNHNKNKQLILKEMF